MRLKQFSSVSINDVNFESNLLTEDVLSLLTRIYERENIFYHE